MLQLLGRAAARDDVGNAHKGHVGTNRHVKHAGLGHLERSDEEVEATPSPNKFQEVGVLANHRINLLWQVGMPLPLQKDYDQTKHREVAIHEHGQPVQRDEPPQQTEHAGNDHGHSAHQSQCADGHVAPLRRLAELR